ncbi:MAG: putative bifunctional diguanylate cyclase/phosphodiesterase [Fimbriimonas sp.]
MAFAGTHVPLIALLAFALITTDGPGHEKVRFLVVALVATLLGTAATLYLISRLLAPISMTYLALRGYIERDEKPVLPTEFTDEAGVLMADTTYVISQLDEAIHRLTNFDPATTLPNRNMFGILLREGIAAAREADESLAVVAIDLSRFGDVQLAHGKEASEVAVRAVAGRLLDLGSLVKGVSRVGDHTFGLLMPHREDFERVNAVARQIQRALAAPIHLDNAEANLRPVVGVAVWPDDAEDEERLWACAESAALAAREKGIHEVALYNTVEDEALRRRFKMEADLRGAVEREEFRIAYQPIVDVRIGRIVAAEALLRWTRDGAAISPAEFIPLAERTGLIVEIGAWVLRAACWEAKGWQSLDRPAIKVSVNVSARQLTDPNFVPSVAAALEAAGLAPNLLQLEMTESTIMEDVCAAAEALARLRGLGVSIAVDDFGTGYSSLSSLKRLPIDVLKVDQSFVRALPDDEDDVAIVKSVSALASSLRMEAVAEGVETPEEARCLVEQGYQQMQGYFFGRPEFADDFTARLRRGSEEGTYETAVITV